MTETELITEDWLRNAGFRWHQVERQSSKHWVLWLGTALGETWAGAEDVGIELAFNENHQNPNESNWFCWLRSDANRRYGRFIHIRHVKPQKELIALVEALTGLPWNPEHHWYGCIHTAQASQRLREQQEHLDQRLLRQGYPWSESEKDESRSGPLREHLNIAIESGKAK